MLNLETGFWHGSESDTWTPRERKNGVTKSTPGDVSRLSDERENYVKPLIRSLVSSATSKKSARGCFMQAGLQRSPVKSNANNWSVIVQADSQVHPITPVLAVRVNTQNNPEKPPPLTDCVNSRLLRTLL